MGILNYRSGKVFKGDFKEGVQVEGIITYPNGDEYCGCVKESKRDGYGIIKYASGESYQGEFEDDLPQGQGIATRVVLGELQSITGVFDKGRLQMGQWKCGEDVYFGEFNEERLFEGKGVYQYSSGDLF